MFDDIRRQQDLDARRAMLEADAYEILGDLVDAGVLALTGRVAAFAEARRLLSLGVLEG